MSVLGYFKMAPSRKKEIDLEQANRERLLAQENAFALERMKAQGQQALALRDSDALSRSFEKNKADYETQQALSRQITSALSPDIANWAGGDVNRQKAAAMLEAGTQMDQIKTAPLLDVATSAMVNTDLNRGRAPLAQSLGASEYATRLAEQDSIRNTELPTRDVEAGARRGAAGLSSAISSARMPFAPSRAQAEDLAGIAAAGLQHAKDSTMIPFAPELTTMNYDLAKDQTAAARKKAVYDAALTSALDPNSEAAAKVAQEKMMQDTYEFLRNNKYFNPALYHNQFAEPGDFLGTSAIAPDTNGVRIVDPNIVPRPGTRRMKSIGNLYQ